MKRIFTILISVLITATVWSQAPQKMSYQAVVRDASGEILISQQVGMRISILEGNNDGASVYTETQTPTTNANGLVTVEIGTGTTSDDFITIDWANDTYFIKTEIDPTGGTSYTITGISQLLSVPYALHAKTAEGIPIYTSAEIAALTPENGQTVFNGTEDLYQIYNGSEWKAFSANCWPLPTVATAGSDQTFTDGTVSATLAANTPEANHGTGLWTVVSGTGGSFDDDTKPDAVFSGAECTAYTLQWTISTSCSSSSDDVNIEFNQTPTTATAGSDQIFTDGTVSATLAANIPEANHGTGLWTVVRGTGGSFDDDTDPTTTFNGTLHEVYTLQWTISTSCSSSTDNVVIAFNQDGAGSTLTDADGNTYNTVYIGSQLWMAENLKVTQEADGTAIPTVTDDNTDGSTDDEWANLGDNDNDKAYCYYNNNASGEAAIYGALYTYAAAKDACPTGWHLPTDAEWTELENYIANDHSGTEGTALKSTSGWNDSGNGTDNYSFSALPGGYRSNYLGTFYNVGYRGNWWSSTEHSSSFAYYRYLYYHNADVYRLSNNKSYGFSVRCVRDN